MSRPLPFVLVIFLLVSFAIGCSYAADLEATLLAPAKDAQVSGSKVEIAVGYKSGISGAVSRIDLVIDGAQCCSRVMEAPRSRGVASMLWDSKLVANGKHKFQVNIYSGPKLLGSVNGSLTTKNDAGDYHPAFARIENLKSGSIVHGASDVQLNVSGLGENPMVTLLIDKTVNSVKNRPPYTFSVETTKLLDGRHVIEAFAMSDAGGRIDAQPVEISVQNKTNVAAAPTAIASAPKTAVTSKPTKPANANPAATAKTMPKPVTKPAVGVAKAASPRKSVPASAKAVTSAKSPEASAKTATTPVAKASENKPAVPPKAANPSVVVRAEVPAAKASAPALTNQAKTAEVTKKPTPTVAKLPAPSSAKPTKAAKAAEKPASTAAPAPAKTSVSIAAVPAGKTTPVAPKNVQPTVKQPAPAAKPAAKPVTAAAAPRKPTAKAVSAAHPAVPPVKMAWAPPKSAKTAPPVETRAAIAEPKPESQDTTPAIKTKPAMPRVAVAPVTTTPRPSLTKPTATAPEPEPKSAKPAPKPVPAPVAKTPAPAANSAPKPAVVAKAPKPAAATTPSPTSDAQQQSRKVMEVSLRWALQMAGLNVSFADEGRVIRGSDGKKTIEFQVGEKEVLVDDHVVVLPSPVTSVGGRAMIPLSFLVEQLGLALKDPSLMSKQTP